MSGSVAYPHGASVAKPEVAADAAIDDVDRWSKLNSPGIDGRQPDRPLTRCAELDFVPSAARAVEQRPLRYVVGADQVNGAA